MISSDGAGAQLLAQSLKGCTGGVPLSTALLVQVGLRSSSHRDTTLSARLLAIYCWVTFPLQS